MGVCSRTDPVRVALSRGGRLHTFSLRNSRQICRGRKVGLNNNKEFMQQHSQSIYVVIVLYKINLFDAESYKTLIAPNNITPRNGR